MCLETAAVATISTLDVRLDSSTGTQFTQIARSTGSQREQCYLGRLLNVAAGTHDIYLSATMSASTITGVQIWAATYQGVNQTTPVRVGDSAANNASLANITFGTAVTIGNSADGIRFICRHGTTTTQVSGFTRHQAPGDHSAISPM
jgi:hypothetical protein